jgi:predicted flap endonuclease-1-like 5' DNA nuclease
MSFDLNSLSSDPLFYFLAHSTLFVVIIAATFFLFGLAFGWVTWARYKYQRRRLISQGEALKNEIALLKRKLAEQIARVSSLAEVQHQNFITAETEPDINAFPEITPGIAHETDGPAPFDAQPAGESRKSRKPVIAPSTKAEPKKDVLQTLIEVGAVPSLTDQPGADRALQRMPDSSGPQTARPAERAAPVTDSPSRLSSDPLLGLIYGERPQQSDNLSDLKGVSKAIEKKLNDLGVYTFKQIALWDDEHLTEFATRLGLKERLRREHWIDHARKLHLDKYGVQL